MRSLRGMTPPEKHLRPPTAAPAPARGTVALRAAAFLTLSFVMSANGNVLPQQFFQRHHAAHKSLWLALCLLVGTTAATVAVWRARRGHAARRAMLATLALTLGAEGALLVLRDAAAYVAVNAAAQFGANTLTNHVDLTASARAGAARRGVHDAVSNLSRLLGILLAPWFFTRFYARRDALLLALGAAGALGFAAVAATFSRDVDEAPQPDGAPAATASAPLSAWDRLLAAYSVGLYLSLYLFAANVLYLLRDVVHLADADRRGGVTISVVFLGALSTNALAAAVRARRPRASSSLLLLGAPAVVLCGAAAALFADAVHSAGVVLIGSLVLGLSYGGFLAEVREWCSRGARDEGKSALLTLFNNMTNLSSLAAFGTMLVLALVARQVGRPVVGPLLLIIGALPAAALIALLASTRRVGRGA